MWLECEMQHIETLGSSGIRGGLFLPGLCLEQQKENPSLGCVVPPGDSGL